MAKGDLARVKSHSREWLFCFPVALVLSAALAGCGGEVGRGEAVRLSGATMGTTWNVTYIEPAVALKPEVAHHGIQVALDAVDASMSTYRADSEITRFNQDHPVNEPFAVSAPFATVVAAALSVGTASGGAYDITVGPLVDLWGFGAAGDVVEPPAADAITAARARVGQEALSLQDHTQLLKRKPLALDVSSLAKGYAVDEVAHWLAAQGISDYLVEVGGEMRVAGQSPRGGPWRIAIEEPSAGHRGVARAILLSNVAVATSGDYRNFFEANGQRYSHTIDPSTGYPVAHDLVSVTVIHSSAMLADAWATAFDVMGAERGRAVAEARSLAVYFIQQGANGFTHSYTPAFAPYLEDHAEVTMQ